MDRRIVYIGAIPQDTDLLLTDKNAMISDGWVAQSILGSSTLFYGLACTPTAPPGMTVNVAPGAAFSQQNIDNSAYGSLSSDTTHQIVKVGINAGTLNLSCPAPLTTGQSVVYLIEAAFQEIDGGSTVLPYYNASNPATPWAGPNNTGVSQNTIRQNLCTVQVKAGTPATTGTQVTPSPDAGFTGLYAVTVANGQTTITSGNIATVGGAPFITESLTQKISQTTADARYAKISQVQTDALDFAVDTSGAANSIVASLSPAISVLSQGMTVVITIANNNNGPSTLNLNGTGATNITNKGNALVGGELAAGQNAAFSYNGTTWNLMSPAANQSQLYTGTASTTGSANAQVLAGVTPSGFTLLFGNIVTFTAGFSNTGATTINVDSTGAVTIKKKNSSGGLIDLASGDLAATDIYQIIYDGVYWELYSLSFPPSSTFFQVANNLSEGVAGTMRSNLGLGSAALLAASAVAQTANNLSDVASPATSLLNLGIAQPEGGITHGRSLVWASTTTINVSAVSVLMKNSAGQTAKSSAPSVTLNSATSGANGLDTGSVANNTWYYIYGVYNPTTSTFASLMSLSSSAPTLPSGYTYSGIMGVALTDGSGHFIGFVQKGNDWQYQVGNNLSGLPALFSGSQGTYGSAYAAISVSTVAPPIAVKIKTTLCASSNATNQSAIAPNGNYGNPGSTTNPPVGMYFGANVASSFFSEIMLESSNVYVQAQANALGFVVGFSLNL